MTEAKFKTMRHIETVRNFLNVIIYEIMDRQEKHDQSKLKSPEVEIFEEYTPKLRKYSYNSKEYKECLKIMSVALDHHYKANRHHPEYHNGYVENMNLVDIIEMLCDWKAATLRHDDGDIFKSIEINQNRFGYSDDLKKILINTAIMIEESGVYHHAEES